VSRSRATLARPRCGPTHGGLFGFSEIPLYRLELLRDLGAAVAVDAACLDAEQVDYVNLHGTATPANDVAEGMAIAAIMGRETPCSSTKGFTGHTLGAAGILETVIAYLAVERGLMPASLNTREIDPAIDINILLENRVGDVHRVMTNSFGFGGSNASLLIGRSS